MEPGRFKPWELISAGGMKRTWHNNIRGRELTNRLLNVYRRIMQFSESQFINTLFLIRCCFNTCLHSYSVQSMKEEVMSIIRILNLYFKCSHICICVERSNMEIWTISVTEKVNKRAEQNGRSSGVNLMNKCTDHITLQNQTTHTQIWIQIKVSLFGPLRHFNFPQNFASP